ncbi:putative bax inhibitor 1-like [Capsicum annuum]|uniref:Bax inhibitor 1-like n=1 Tax=Capsicum annuum TaxID=4072 RepID=A0A2G3AM85_CAPAN|nr:putative bax inhibitor 1-like [Capsicum annuum]KAF3656145.1 putative bax inhibitor 1-like [Capsicum annuum]PHT95329.1 hypothetical protein T459_03211 [Capsicum annuum]
MKFSGLKLRAANAYFIRNWRRQDLMNSGKMLQHAYQSLKKVYLTLFCAMLAFTFGSFLHLIWEAGGPFTVCSSVASLLWLYSIPPWRVKAFACLLPSLVVSLLSGSSIGYGILWLGALLTQERKETYIGCMVYSSALILSSFVVDAFDILDSYTADWMLKVYTVHALFMGYLVVYSQEILYDARFEEIDFVNRTLTVLFHLPGILVHAARLILGAEIEQHRQN